MTSTNQLEKLNKQYYHFNTLCNIQKKKSGKLKDYLISIKDDMCVKNVESKAGGAILTGYKPLFNATVVENLLNEGATIIGKNSSRRCWIWKFFY